jgi:predicted enzyme involved in methoxymalonyl-ACP biosynthesis
MSCRVIGRTVEHALVRHLIDTARRQGITTLIGEFIPTIKNAQVSSFWESVGFEPLAASADIPGESRRFRLRLADAVPIESFVRIPDDERM